MIIKASKNEIEFLEQQLHKLIKENKSNLSRASDDEIRAGIATLSENLSVNRALVSRAIEHIRNALTERIITHRYEVFDGMNSYNEWFARQEEEERMDSIGPELLGVDMDDEPQF